MSGVVVRPLNFTVRHLVRRQRTRFLLLFAAVCVSAHADDKGLANFIAALKRHTDTAPAPVSLAATDAKDGRDLVLRFTLTNISAKPLPILDASLPWGSTYAITWAAITSDGRVLPMTYPIDDPFPGKSITLAPAQSITGTYDLNRMLEREAVPHSADIVVLWLYSFPAGPSEKRRDTRPVCSGVTVVHVPQ